MSHVRIMTDEGKWLPHLPDFVLRRKGPQIGRLRSPLVLLPCAFIVSLEKKSQFWPDMKLQDFFPSYHKNSPQARQLLEQCFIVIVWKPLTWLDWWGFISFGHVFQEKILLPCIKHAPFVLPCLFFKLIQSRGKLPLISSSASPITTTNSSVSVQGRAIF